jgi:hypothetical protein
MRTLAFVVSLMGASVAVAESPKPNPPEVEQVFKELDLPPTESTLRELPKGFEADAVTEFEVRNNAKKYPLRMKVLEALDALSAARRITVDELVITGFDENTKKAVRVRQEAIATSIAELEETIADLQGVAEARKGETKRWQAHYDFVLAECRLRVAMLNIQNAAYGSVILEHLPDLNAKNGENGWKLVLSKTIVGPGRLPKTARIARDEMAELTTTYEKTPWGKAAERAVAKPMGLVWEPTKLALRD